MAGSALRRLMAEYKQISQNPPDGLAAGIIKNHRYIPGERFLDPPPSYQFCTWILQEVS